jgi:hypothetical protein
MRIVLIFTCKGITCKRVPVPTDWLLDERQTGERITTRIGIGRLIVANRVFL